MMTTCTITVHNPDDTLALRVEGVPVDEHGTYDLDLLRHLEPGEYTLSTEVELPNSIEYHGSTRLEVRAP